MNREKLEKALEHYKCLNATVEAEIGSNIHIDTKELWSTAVEALEFCLQNGCTADVKTESKAQEALNYLTNSRYGKELTHEGYEKIMDALFELHRLEYIRSLHEN